MRPALSSTTSLGQLRGPQPSNTHSLSHRVMAPGAKDRLSIPYFFNPALHIRASPMTDHSPHPPGAAAEGPRAGEPGAGAGGGPGRAAAAAFSPSAAFASNTLCSVYGDNAFKSLARSHPEVVRRHHPDLRVQSDGTCARAGPGVCGPGAGSESPAV